MESTVVRQHARGTEMEKWPSFANSCTCLKFPYQIKWGGLHFKHAYQIWPILVIETLGAAKQYKPVLEIHLYLADIS